MPQLYLDIDGVLLTKNKQVPEGASALLWFALAHFDCYWLTTHCKGQAETAVRYLQAYYPAELLEALRAVKPTDWDTLKTDGIALREDFYWVDDYPFEAEKQVLEASGLLPRLLVCDLRREGELRRIGQVLAHALATGSGEP
jgi:hypothetical protein